MIAFIHSTMVEQWLVESFLDSLSYFGSIGHSWQDYIYLSEEQAKHLHPLLQELLVLPYQTTSSSGSVAGVIVSHTSLDRQLVILFRS